MDNEALSARLKAFALMLKFGHDLFDAKDFRSAAALAVSNSRSLLNFRTASLLELADGKAQVIAQYGQPEPNVHSRLALLQERLALSLVPGEEPQILTRKNGLSPELAAGNAVYCCCFLRPPANTAGTEFSFLWLLEYEKEIPAYVPNTVKLLAASVSEALHYQRLCKNGLWKVKRHVKRNWIRAALFVFLCALMFLPVSESATAEFTLKAPVVTCANAWFDGQIARCLVQDGEIVKKGDPIVEFDTAQLSYRLASAQGTLRELEAELALEQQNAFTDEARLGKVKLLAARRETARIAVDEAKWYLEHSRICAPADGLLVLADGRAEQLAGKAVRTGDKLFEVFGGEGMAAEIPVDERDASILRGVFSVTLYLHTAPETAIPAEIREVSRYPELTERKTFCYMVRAELAPGAESGMRYGMRGIAKLSGGKVTLGYRLFKSALLYFREW